MKIVIFFLILLSLYILSYVFYGKERIVTFTFPCSHLVMVFGKSSKATHQVLAVSKIDLWTFYPCIYFDAFYKKGLKAEVVIVGQKYQVIEYHIL